MNPVRGGSVVLPPMERDMANSFGVCLWPRSNTLPLVVVMVCHVYQGLGQGGAGTV